MPVLFSPTPGRRADAPEGREPIKRVDVRTEGADPVTDRACEGDETRDPAREKGLDPVVPPGKNGRNSREHDREELKRRNGIDRPFRRLKGRRRFFARTTSSMRCTGGSSAPLSSVRLRDTIDRPWHPSGSRVNTGAPPGPKPDGRAALLVCILLPLLLLAACRTPANPSIPERAPRPELPPSVRYSQNHDAEIREIFSLARRSRWEEALVLATQLKDKDDEDPLNSRVFDWVEQQLAITRDQAVEDTIRRIDSQNSTYNPSIVDYFTEHADRGLPPRKDLRDTVQEIESTPYIPDSYNRTNQVDAPSFDFQIQKGKMSTILDKKIEDLRLNDMTLEEAILLVGPAEQLNLVLDKSLDALKENISVDFKGVRLGEFLEFIEHNYDISFRIGDNLIWVVGKEEGAAFTEFRSYPLRHGFLLPAKFEAEVEKVTITRDNKNNTTTERSERNRNYFVSDGTPEKPAIETAIEKFFEGDYIIDHEKNTIFARGTREQLEIMERIIEMYDIPPKQVLIEARFITVSEAGFMKLGALWETGRPDLSGGQAPIDYLGFGREDVGRGLQESFHNILDRNNLSLTLTALEQQGETHILSAPRITVVNNLPARISDGKVQNYYEQYTSNTSTTEQTIVQTLVPEGKPKEITSGVTLEVLASIGGDGETIYLALHPEVNQDVKMVPFVTVSDATGNKFEIRLPEWRTQSLNTRAVVQSGQTVVMGGVLEREQSRFVEGVPILGKIPFIGSAFRRRTELDKPRYLLIFVTATLLSQSGEFLEVRDTPRGPPPPPQP